MIWNPMLLRCFSLKEKAMSTFDNDRELESSGKVALASLEMSASGH